MSFVTSSFLVQRILLYMQISYLFFGPRRHVLAEQVIASHDQKGACLASLQWWSTLRQSGPYLNEVWLQQLSQSLSSLPSMVHSPDWMFSISHENSAKDQAGCAPMLDTSGEHALKVWYTQRHNDLLCQHQWMWWCRILHVYCTNSHGCILLSDPPEIERWCSTT